MGRKKIIANDLSEAAILERAKSMSNQWIWAISLQYDRIINPRLQDKEFHPFGIDSFHEADVHYFIISLMRLRRIAMTLEHVPQVWNPVSLSINNFDKKLPWVKRLRDVFEHLEDYAVDSDLRRSKTSRSELQVYSFNEDGMNWLGYDINWYEGIEAAKVLFSSIKTAYNSYIPSK